LINQADSAMSGAKKKTDKIQGFSEQDESVSREFYLEHDLKRALKNEEFLVYYQPQIDFRTGRILGVEALLRWNHPEKGIVAPSEFIPVLERIGMIAATDQWVLHKVCEQLRSWQAEGLFLNASVNLSAQELNSERIIRVIREALNRTGLHGSYLEIELTESEIMGNVQQASEILRTLSDWGIRIALDDFGKGYSCMSYLQQLPISIIKIDKEFVDGLPGREDSVTLVQTIVAMAHNLGKKALAEGVESESQARILRELGCDYGQGFLWGRPRPHEYLVLRGYL
jgi:EAL domain-containing protein (putative c-di-GMP-specific phosphodiesterase class I)